MRVHEVLVVQRIGAEQVMRSRICPKFVLGVGEVRAQLASAGKT